MKSLCIKTNYSHIIEYLLESLENSNLENTYISTKKFKHFYNLIIHHKGQEHNSFYFFLANSLTKMMIAYYEKECIRENIHLNYFYFRSSEKKQILENTITLLEDPKLALERYQLIYNSILQALQNNHSFYMQSFIQFQLSKYNAFLNTQIDSAVNQFLINKEYIEFVNILKLYVKSETMCSKTDHLHVIYQNKTSTIVDDNKNIINCNDNMKKMKYVSDISFSSNDFALNTLLNLVPKEITLHLVDGYCDEFTNTLKLIFQEHVKICEDCDICHLYRQKEMKQ